MSKNKINHFVDLLFTLTLFGFFAVSAILVVIFGARVYQNTINNMSDNYTSRTALSYITEKLRQRDTEGAVSLTSYEDVPAIILRRQEDIDFENTYIYAKDGGLYEIMENGVDTPDPSKAHKLMDLKDFNVKEISSGIYYVTIVNLDGSESSAYISTKCDPGIYGRAMDGPQAPGE